MEKIANNRVEMVGKKFGKWEVLEYSHTKGKKAYYRCKCECGNETIVQGTNIRLGRSSQCRECSLKQTWEKNKGKPLTEERKQNISKARTGQKHTEETKEKLRGNKDEMCDSELLEVDSTRSSSSNRGLRIANAVRYKRNSANARGKPWSLTNLEAAKLIIQPCHYCGDAPKPYHGIDRVDNSRGYEIDNVVTCCKYCNSAKLDMTVEEFKAYIKRIYKHMNLGDKP